MDSPVKFFSIAELYLPIREFMATALPAALFRRADESSDLAFYQQPRFVAHIEPATIEAVTRLYRELLPPGGAILDIMSSWISHLPDEMKFARVAATGMNQRELEANPRLTDFQVHDLNADPRLPFEDASFDAAICCVSVQYLTRPLEVFADVARVCRAGAPLILTFSNRCFPTKAVAAWQSLDDRGHLELVAHYLQAAGDWDAIEMRDCTPHPAREPLLAVTARRS